jgi:hypothetical protein
MLTDAIQLVLLVWRREEVRREQLFKALDSAAAAGNLSIASVSIRQRMSAYVCSCSRRLTLLLLQVICLLASTCFTGTKVQILTQQERLTLLLLQVFCLQLEASYTSS